jgi:ubiquinone/menaquinone biosynthesis C-methylase UbiE
MFNFLTRFIQSPYAQGFDRFYRQAPLSPAYTELDQDIFKGPGLSFNMMGTEQWSWLHQNISPQKSLCDLGCGIGELAKSYPDNSENLGLDFSAQAIEQAMLRNKNTQWSFQCWDYSRGRIPVNRKWDQIVSIDSLYQFSSKPHLLNRLKKYLNNDGRLIIFMSEKPSGPLSLFLESAFLIEKKRDFSDEWYFTIQESKKFLSHLSSQERKSYNFLWETKEKEIQKNLSSFQDGTKRFGLVLTKK